MDTTPNLDSGSAPAPAEVSEDQMRNLRIDVLQSMLLGKRKAWIDHKMSLGIDDRINEDLEIYYGRVDPGNPEADAPKWFENKSATPKKEGAQKSRVRVNITQGKADAAIARVQEILFPIDDRNFSIDPTPVPELEHMVRDDREILNAQPGPDGKRPKVSDIARQFSDQAERSSDLMEEEIADQLEECEYPRIGRSVVEMGGICGTGIVKGPVVMAKVIRRGVMGIFNDKPTVIVQKETALKPISEEVDPRNFVPDPTCLGDIRRASGVFERRAISRSELRALADRPGYLKDRIAATLAERPKMTVTTEAIRAERELAAFMLTDNYELWEYHGELEAEHAAAMMGVGINEISQLFSVKVCVVFVNDRIIGAYEYIVDCDGFIYDIFNWKKNRDSVFGYGIVWAYRTQQRVINAAWRGTMDQMGVAAGVSIIAKRGKVAPADGSTNIGGRKFYWASDDVQDVRTVFAVHDVPSKLKDFIALIEVAKALGDEEINLPQIMQGFKGSAPDQVGSLLALLAKAEGVLRKVVKQYDDDCTKPHIKRYYSFNMKHNPREDIKGDSQVMARGADVLFMRDLRAQVTLLMAKLTESPKFAPWLKEKELLEEIARSGYINPTRVIKTEDQYKRDAQAAAQSSPPDPRIVAEELRLKGKAMQVADQKEQRQVDVALAQNSDKLRVAELMQKRDEAFARLAADQKMSVAQLLQQWKIALVDVDAENQRFNAEAQLRRDTGEGI